MKTFLLVFLFLCFNSSISLAQVQVTNSGLQGSDNNKYVIVSLKNTSGKTLKNIVICYDIKIKMAKNGKEWESKNTEMVEVKELKANATYENKQNFNNAVIQVLSTSFSSIIQK